MSKTKKQEAFIVWSNTDLTEGRGYEYAKYICAKESTATRLAKKAYVMGSDARVTKTELILHNNQWCGPVFIHGPSKEDEQLERQLEEQRRVKAAKDAAIERAKALGLTDADIAALRG